jgi:hypothetical protein
MALFRNPPPAAGQVSVKLRGSLCDVLKYVSAQPLVFLDLAKNYPFMNWKLIVPIIQLMDGRKMSRRFKGFIVQR